MMIEVTRWTDTEICVSLDHTSAFLSLEEARDMLFETMLALGFSEADVIETKLRFAAHLEDE